MRAAGRCGAAGVLGSGGDAVKRNELLLAMVLSVSLAWVGLAQNASQELESLRKKKQEVEAQYNSVYAEYRTARAAIYGQEAVAELYRHMLEAREDRDRKIQSSATIRAARKASDEAYAAMNQVLEGELAADGQGRGLLAELAKLEDVLDEDDAQQRLANFKLSEIKRRLGRHAEVKAAQRALEKAESAVAEAMRGDASIGAASKALEEARKIPLGQPQMEALQQAYEQAVKSSQAVSQATQGREGAKKTYEELMAAKFAAHPETAGLKRQVEELERKLAEGQAARKRVSMALEEARQRVSKDNAKVVTARQAYSAAYAAYSQAVAGETPNESAAVEDIQRQYYDKIEELFSADPKASMLRQEVNRLTRALEEVGAQIRKAEAQAGR